MMFVFQNQWKDEHGSRDFTWFGIETSSFRTATWEGHRFNIHMFVLGLGITVWF